MPEQLWVADITYVPKEKGFLYLSIVTDAYSHKIMGYQIADTLEAVNTVRALKMALKSRTTESRLIHHSDRGLQYCCTEYVNLLQSNGIEISMTEDGNPLDNPIAERINGIIKQEYLQHYQLTDPKNAMKTLVEIVNKYNEKRPHQSINMQTPEIVHSRKLLINRKWNKIH